MTSLEILLIIYGGGFLLTTLFLVWTNGGFRKMFGDNKGELALRLSVLVLWPIFLPFLVLDYVISELPKHYKRYSKKVQSKRYIKQLCQKLISQVQNEDITQYEINALMNGASELASPTNLFGGPFERCKRYLETYWNEDIGPEEFLKREIALKLEKSSSRDLKFQISDKEDSVRFSAIPPVEKGDVAHSYTKPIDVEKISWSVRFTTEFIKSIKNIDKKLKGRILEAVEKLSLEPCEMIGDTIKPLSDDLKGLWRYRIGDYRLLYIPEDTKHQVILMSFGPRGGVYG